MTQALTAAENWTVLLPELALVGGAMLILAMNAIFPTRRGIAYPVFAAEAIVVSGILTTMQWGEAPVAALGEMVVRDNFGVFARWVILGAALLAVLTAHGYLRQRGLDRAEFYALLLLSSAGMTLLAVSSDLVMVFLSVELLSLALYIMAGFERSRLDAQEASMKYFLLGAFASAFLLYGIAFTYGASGTTNLLRLRDLIAVGGVADLTVLGLAMAFLAVGLGFKASLVPFHMWTPDAYQGAPTPVTVFMVGATKTAAFAAIFRVLVGTLFQLRLDWQPVVAVLSAVTIVVASVLAIAQTDVKRMLAYSSVSHAGFIAMAVVTSTQTGVAAGLLYLLIYAAMTIGAFSCVMLFREGAGERVHLSKYSGLGVRRPLAAALFAMFLFSLAGIPPLGGFWAKWYVLFSAIRADYTWLAAVAVLASVAAAFFYARVAVVMFMQEPHSADQMPLTRSAGLRVTLGICAALVIGTGIAPEFFLSLAERAVSFAG